MIFHGTLEEFENWSDCEPDSRERVRVVPDVIDVPVSPSSVVTFLQKACALLYKYARRDDVRRLTRESASDNEKKNDTSYTNAKFVHLL